LRKKYWASILILALGLWFTGFGMCQQISAQPLTHTVKKGDTLWDICEKYYGDSNLWPKLWQMNVFVTNPHLLNQGDIISLLEDIPVIKPPEKPRKVITPPAIQPQMGIDISGITNPNSIGFLSAKRVKPCGKIISNETKRAILSKGDIIYLIIEKENSAKPGNLYSVYSSSLQRNPVTDKAVGYVVSILGKVIIKTHVNDNLYKAEIIESYRTIQVEDLLIPYEPVSPCIQPLPVEGDMIAQIVAVKDQHELLGQFSAIYLATGYDQGIRRGNIFEIVKKIEDPSSQKVVLPDIILGYLLIVETRPNTSSGIVPVARGEFYNGNLLKALDWEAAQHILALFPECIVE